MIKNKLALGLNLKPNCLLTRYPLLLITGPRSIFNYQHPWSDLPEVLYQHGYQVELLSLPFRNTQLRQQVLRQRQEALKKNHVIIDQASFFELEELLQQTQPQSLTVVASTKNASTRIRNAMSTFERPIFIWSPCYKLINPLYSIKFILHRWFCRLNGSEIASPEENFWGSSTQNYYAFIDHCVHIAELDFQKDS